MPKNTVPKNKPAPSAGASSNRPPPPKGSGRKRASSHANSPTVTTPFAKLVGTVKSEVDARLAGLFDAKLEAAGSLGKEVVDMLAATRDLSLRGGKRLRAALVAVGYRCVQSSWSLDPALDVGAALELLQSYFLIHDDWMDADAVRRGGPTVHTVLSKRFKSAKKGAASAILAGDYCVALASEALARANMPPKRAQAVFAGYAQMQLDAVAGQQLDLVGAGRRVETTYRLKTGSYTVAGPLRLGALLGGGTGQLLEMLDRFAMPIGIGFQLRDDLLGAFGDPARTGKPRGSDVRSGKHTLLLVLALKRAKGKDLDLLTSVCGNATASERQLEKALAVLEACGAKTEVEERIADLHAAALAALRPRIATSVGYDLLKDAAQVLTRRSH